MQVPPNETPEVVASAFDTGKLIFLIKTIEVDFATLVQIISLPRKLHKLKMKLWKRITC